MKNKFDPTKWTPVVPEHPEPTKRYPKHAHHEQPNWQPPSERYEVPGLLPRAPRKSNPDNKPY